MVLSSIKQGFCSNITCFIFRETQIFQLTQLSRIENVNCELLKGLAKEKLQESWKGEMCKHMAEEILHRYKVKLAGIQTLYRKSEGQHEASL